MVAISTDDVATLARFKASLALPFELLSDAGGKVARAYGARMTGLPYAARKTFVIDAHGTVVEIFEGKDALDPAAAMSACRSGR